MREETQKITEEPARPLGAWGDRSCINDEPHRNPCLSEPMSSIAMRTWAGYGGAILVRVIARVRASGEGLFWWVGLCILAVVVGRTSATSPKLAVGAFGLGAIGLLVAARRGVMLIEVTILALVWGSSTLPLGSFAYPLKFAMFGVLALAAVPALVSVNRRHLPIPAGFTTAFAATLALALGSFAWSIDPSLTLARAASMVLLAAAVCIGVPLSLRDGDDVRRVYYVVGVTLGGVSVLGLLLGAIGVVDAFQSDGRYQGLLGNANTLGYFAATLLPPVVLLAAQQPAGRRRRLLVLAAALTAMGIALSGSRGGTIASVVGIAAGLLSAQLGGQARSVRRVVLVAGSVALAAVLVFPLLGRSVRTVGTGTQGFFVLGTGSNRTVSWRDAIPKILEDPILGHGFGTTPILYPSLQSQLQGTILGAAHNGYIDSSLELGIGGAVIVLLLAGSGVVAAFHLGRGSGVDRMLGPILLAAIVGGMVESLVESGVLNAGGTFAFPFWMAVALAHSLRIAQLRVATGTGRGRPLNERSFVGRRALRPGPSALPRRHF
jgi:O-antigen ligase